VATAQLLEGAGWRDVRSAEHLLPLPFGGGLDPAAAAEMATDFGPSHLAVEPLDEAGRAAAVTALTSTFASHVDEQGHVVMDGFVYMVTARR
jgi:hypothetical protein